MSLSLQQRSDGSLTQVAASQLLEFELHFYYGKCCLCMYFILKGLATCGTDELFKLFKLFKLHTITRRSQSTSGYFVVPCCSSPMLTT